MNDKTMTDGEHDKYEHEQEERLNAAAQALLTIARADKRYAPSHGQHLAICALLSCLGPTTSEAQNDILESVIRQLVFVYDACPTCLSSDTQRLWIDVAGLAAEHRAENDTTLDRPDVGNGPKSGEIH